MTQFTRNNRTSAFTLIELLVVIAILAILATVIVVIINPGELLKQSRDTDRLADLASINKALGLLLADQPNISLGRNNIVYVSLPDVTLSGAATSSCASLGLPTLPSPYTYECHSPQNYRKVDGTGWIPVNLAQFSTGTILSTLPVDPNNASSTRTYYTYTMNSNTGGWELATSLESMKYKAGGTNDKTTTDKGVATGLYEVGPDLSLIPTDYGDTSLVGYWSFDEGSGTTAYDRSGNGYNQGIYGSGYNWPSSCKLGGCISLTENSYAYVLNAEKLSFGTGDFSLVAWVNHTRRGDLLGSDFFGNYAHTGQYGDMSVGNFDNSTYVFLSHQPYPSGSRINCSIDYAPYFGSWNHLAYTKNGDVLRIYVNGQLKNTCTVSGWNVLLNESNKYYINSGWRTGNLIIDEHRIYSKALSAEEVLSLYNTTR